VRFYPSAIMAGLQKGSIVDMQKMIDVMSETWRRDRSRYHLNLGDLISDLDDYPENALVEFDTGGYPCEPHSYRGYYSDLAFESGNEPLTASALLKVAKKCLGKTFTGYKGGNYVMAEDTPLWKAFEGCTGKAIVDMQFVDGKMILHTKEVD
jgi:hypothetical protein